MKFKKGGWSGTLLIAALFLCLGARGQVIGVIRMQESLMATAEMKLAIQQLEKQHAPRRTRLAEMRRATQSLVEYAMKGDPTPSPGSPMYRKMQQAFEDLNRFQSDLEHDEAVGLQARLNPVRRRMLVIIENLAKARGVGLILDAKGVYLHSAFDLTADAVKSYDRVHPVY